MTRKLPESVGKIDVLAVLLNGATIFMHRSAQGLFGLGIQGLAIDVFGFIAH